MNTRRWSALVAALTVTAVVTACSGGPNSGGDSNTLTLASVDQGSIEQVVAAFEAANPGVKVNFTTAGADQYQQQIRTQLASGTAPDVFTVWPGNGNPGATYVLAPPGYLLDMSDQPWASKLPAGLQSVARYEGKTYNAVFGVNGIGAIYNQDALDNAGLEAPTTWTELLAFCQAAAAKGTPAFALGNQDNWVTQLILYALVATTVYSEDPDFDTKLQAGQTSFADSEWSTALNKYIEMEQTGCFQENPLGTSYEASQQLVASGQTLGLVQGNWVIALLKGINPGPSYVFTPLPANDDPDSTYIPAAAGAGYGVNANAKNKELALKFISFVMSPEGMSVFNEAQGSLPALADTGFDVDPSLTELTDFINAGRTVPFMDQLWPNPKVQQTMLSGLQEIFSDQTTAEQLLADMDADYRS
jgi:raffinose/stachyose/melibiose transport system substrate-binding protein